MLKIVDLIKLTKKVDEKIFKGETIQDFQLEAKKRIVNMFIKNNMDTEVLWQLGILKELAEKSE